MGYIKKYSDKRLISKKKEQEESALFFEKAIQIFQEHPYSIESNKYISNINRLNIAHLFPKRKYKSVQYNLKNVILLTGDEHTRFDTLLDRMDFEKLEQEFKSWNLIKKQMIELLPFIEERGNLYLKFLDYVEIN